MDSDMGESRSTKKMRVEQEGVKGSLVLKKNSFKDEILNIKDAFFGRKISLQLISSHSSSSSSANGELARGKVGKEAYLENWLSTTVISSSADDDSVTFDISFDYEEEDIGVPGAFMIKNNHRQELYIKTLTLEHVPNHGPVHFICNSWVYPNECYKKPRVFFANQAYLPSKTPVPLLCYREEELLELRGTGTGKLEEYDRVYDYDIYNDLSEPDKGPEGVRPILGGCKEYPYPRRGRTGRPRTKIDPETESRLPILQSLSIYVPRDERFNALKMSDVYAYGLKLLSQVAVPGIEAVFDKLSDTIVGALEHVLVNHKFDDTKFDEFKSFEDVLKLYEGGVQIPNSPFLEGLRMKIPSEFLRELLRSDGEHLTKFPKPQVIQEDTEAWKTDEEFARQMVAGINPVHIRRLEMFPPTSKLDPARYGNQNSTMTREHLIDQLDGLEIDEAIEKNKLFILDHHDPLMPYLRGINETSTKIYATRTLFFLQKDGTLKPVVIELSLPHPDGDQAGAVSSVYTPAGPEDGALGTIWQLAKAYVCVNDSGYHQLISHWLHTHAAIEPFIIATNRHLSVLHPINKLLQPHFRDTMNINALARQTLINAGGLLEKTVFPDKYALEMSCAMYKDHWTFPQQALPADLIMRGVAVEDPSSRHGLRLLIEDYPYAVDGLEIWAAIKTWVKDYCSIYYGNDDYEVQNDSELQNWWEEIRTIGHGDKKDEPWWFKMQTFDELIEACTIIIWVASALHAAVNFGQYPYGGYLPNRPATTRRLIPEPGTPEYQELETDPEKAFLKTVTSQLQSILGISLVEILSRHSADEVFLGERPDSPDHWTADEDAIGAFKRFGMKLKEIEERITSMNCDEKWRNRTGPAKVPYTLLYPSSEVGLTGKGIPNSVSI